MVFSICHYKLIAESPWRIRKKPPLISVIFVWKKTIGFWFFVYYKQYKPLYLWPKKKCEIQYKNIIVKGWVISWQNFPRIWPRILFLNHKCFLHPRQLSDFLKSLKNICEIGWTYITSWILRNFSPTFLIKAKTWIVWREKATHFEL